MFFKKHYILLLLGLLYINNAAAQSKKELIQSLERKVNLLENKLKALQADSDLDNISDYFDVDLKTPLDCPTNSKGIALDSDQDGKIDCEDRFPYKHQTTQSLKPNINAIFSAKVQIISPNKKARKYLMKQKEWERLNLKLLSNTELYNFIQKHQRQYFKTNTNAPFTIKKSIQEQDNIYVLIIEKNGTVQHQIINFNNTHTIKL